MVKIANNSTLNTLVAVDETYVKGKAVNRTKYLFSLLDIPQEN